VTAYKKGALPVPKGGHNQRLLGPSSKRKVAMAARIELNGNITHPAGNGPHLIVQHGSGTAARRGLAACVVGSCLDIVHSAH
jgi:hypothetical protein